MDKLIKTITLGEKAKYNNSVVIYSSLRCLLEKILAKLLFKDCQGRRTFNELGKLFPNNHLRESKACFTNVSASLW